MTKQLTEALAKFDRNYVARRIHGNWVVWCKVSDHVVEFDQRAIDNAEARLAWNDQPEGCP
jgi:hypothetical protein